MSSVKISEPQFSISKMGEYPSYGRLRKCGLKIKENVYEAYEKKLAEEMEYMLSE